MNSLYPWLNIPWQQWLQRAEQGKAPASLLVASRDGLGSDRLIRNIAKSLLCTTSDDACGFCHSCQLFSAGNHPDFHHITPEKEGKAISVDTIRLASKAALNSSQLGGTRVIYISPAESMNESAANALLKTLEEPAASCYFILETLSNKALLATILSRCQRVNVAHPSPDVFLRWLSEQGYTELPQYLYQLAEGSPVEALRLLESGLYKETEQLAEKWLKFVASPKSELVSFGRWLAEEPDRRLSWLWMLFSDVIRYQMGLQSNTYLPCVQDVAANLSPQRVQEMMQNLARCRNELKLYSGLNAELMVINWLTTTHEVACL